MQSVLIIYCFKNAKSARSQAAELIGAQGSGLGAHLSDTLSLLLKGLGALPLDAYILQQQYSCQEDRNAFPCVLYYTFVLCIMCQTCYEVSV